MNSNTADNNALDREALLSDLSKLSEFAYQQERKDTATALGVTVSALDKEIKARRKGNGDERPAGGSTLRLEPPDPWPGDVKAADLLNEIRAVFKRYLVLPEHGAVALTLWCAFTFFAEQFYHSPRLLLTSPEKRCGKSTLMRLLFALCCKPLPAVNITPAALFRTVEVTRPTLLLDEADAFLRDNEDMRGLLNSGWTKDGAVIRTVGDEHEPRSFSTFCPVATAGIGNLAETLADRAIIIELKRKTVMERVDRLRGDRLGAFEPYKQKLAKLALREISRFEDPRIPAALNDRQCDNWRPMLAIADMAGGEWPTLSRTACEALSKDESESSDGYRIVLLQDIREIFDKRQKNTPPLNDLTTPELIRDLTEDESKPWADWRHGKPINARQLANLLKPFGIRPDQWKENNVNMRGYRKADFVDSWTRYLPSKQTKQSTPDSIRDAGTYAENQVVTQFPIRDGSAESPGSQDV